ncbi:DUF3986 family protein [Cytobacillus sp. FJAT-53684]|uniref:DUF3986 family protein n=1 Tax=Cytobacillus mangrovibacter TaxID=3299024 RepID=A0ABW6K3J9_9BACI
MEHIQLLGHTVLIDKELTKILYKELPLLSDKKHCGCPDCSNYVKACGALDEQVKDFFEQFGVDPRKEGEIWHVYENEDGVHYYDGFYHFVGEIVGTRMLDWIEVGNFKFGLTNSSNESTLVPDSFPNPIIELSIKAYLSWNVEYDGNYHLHLGYYENNNDIECVALKRESEDVWDVFFDFKQYGFQNLTPKNSLSIEGFGSRIFFINTKELAYDRGAEQFEKWLASQKLI